MLKHDYMPFLPLYGFCALLFMGDMYSIHSWNKFLYIIVANFYILLEQLSMHFYTILYIVGAHFYALLGHFVWVRAVTILYIVLCIV